MQCPRCQKDEVSSDGICPACNYKVVQTETIKEPESGAKESRNSPGDAEAPPPQNELPAWRQELTQRLTALKQNKDTAKSSRQPQSGNNPPGSHTAPAKINIQPASLSPEHAGTIQVKKQIPKIPTASRSTRPTTPQQKTIASLGPDVYIAGRESESPDTKNIRDLIDSSVSKQSTLSRGETPIFRPEPPVEKENKLILLSRTLSGLIDLIVVVLCTGVFIISADYFSGIVILDSISLVEYAGLFLLIYFLYSIFFLVTSGQTIGMMITDLRIIGIEGTRPSIGQLFIRCFGYLLSVLVIGAGLFWSFFDRNNMCFHDRFSNTSITRL